VIFIATIGIVFRKMYVEGACFRVNLKMYIKSHKKRKSNFDLTGTSLI